MFRIEEHSSIDRGQVKSIEVVKQTRKAQNLCASYLSAVRTSKDMPHDALTNLVNMRHVKIYDRNLIVLGN